MYLHPVSVCVTQPISPCLIAHPKSNPGEFPTVDTAGLYCFASSVARSALIGGRTLPALQPTTLQYANMSEPFAARGVVSHSISTQSQHIGC